ncbi:MAG: hypothetical protein IJ654_01265 [Bacteroidales bacterium]|nr:hypothetical protein [Bacteroidales bacterium]
MKKIFVILLFAFVACNPRFVTYEQFGAVGDGVHDDFPAIVETHRFANEKGLPVKADEGKTYLLRGDGLTAVIQTDVDFGQARFVIDDVDLTHYKTPVFLVKPSQEPVQLDGIASLSRGQKSLGVALPARSLVEVVDDSEKVYIRKGLNQNNGTDKTEVFVADADGTIEASSAPVWDYVSVSKMVAYPIDRKTLTIRGGVFTTRANQMPSRYTYHHRGFQIERSNVRVEGLTHLVEGELEEHGAPYTGFLNVVKAADILITGCTFTAHKTYQTIGAAGLPVSMGSYDLGANRAVNIRWEHCRQTTDIDDSRYWGLFGSNFCKNLSMDDCVFSRFDAHMGVKDVTLTNCTFGHMGVQMVGFGTILLQDSEVRASRLISFRSDYGSSWDGDIIVRNCRFVPARKSLKELSLIIGTNDGTHDFGYECRLPEKILLENLVIDDSGLTDERYAGPMIFGTFGRDVSKPDLLPYRAEGQVVLKNVTVLSGKPLGLSRNEAMFRGYEVLR